MSDWTKSIYLLLAILVKGSASPNDSLRWSLAESSPGTVLEGVVTCEHGDRLEIVIKAVGVDALDASLDSISYEAEAFSIVRAGTLPPGREVREDGSWTYNMGFLVHAYAMVEGSHTLPPMGVSFPGGHRLMTPGIQVDVGSSDQVSLIKTELIVDRSDPFIGEEVSIELIAHGDFRPHLKSLQARVLWNPFDLGFTSASDNQSGSDPIVASGIRFDQNFRLLQTEGPNGEQILKWRGRWRPQQSGSKAIEMGFLRLDAHDRVFVGALERTTIEVRDPPLADRPESWVGAIGDFEFRGSRDGDFELKLGEPFRYRLSVKSDSELKPGALPFQEPDFRNIGFYLVDRQVLWGPLKVEVTYELVRQRLDAVEIPRVDFTWFDLGDKAYKTETVGPFKVSSIPKLESTPNTSLESESLGESTQRRTLVISLSVLAVMMGSALFLVRRSRLAKSFPVNSTSHEEPTKREPHKVIPIDPIYVLSLAEDRWKRGDSRGAYRALLRVLRERTDQDEALLDQEVERSAFGVGESESAQLFERARESVEVEINRRRSLPKELNS